MKVLYIPDLHTDRKALEEGKDIVYQQLMKSIAQSDIHTRINGRGFEWEHDDPRHILLDMMLDGPYDLVVGKGFGSVFAVIVGQHLQCRAILVNPMYPIKRYLPYEIPDYRESYADSLASLEFSKFCWSDHRETLKNVFVILGRDNDVVDVKSIPDYFYRGNSLFVEGGDSPKGNDFIQVFDLLILNPDESSDETRERLLFLESAKDEVDETDAPQDGPAEFDLSEGESGKVNDSTCTSSNDRIVVSMKTEGIQLPESDDSDAGAFASNECAAKQDRDEIKIDEVRIENGNFAIRWHYANSEFKRCLYLYYENGDWYIDGEIGFSPDFATGSEVLSKASRTIIARAKKTEHFGQDYWGWAW